MIEKEQFIYSPETMSFADYWKIACVEAQNGRFIPFYFYDKAAMFASKLFSILSERKEWERCYCLRIKRLAFKWHKYKYSTFNKI